MFAITVIVLICLAGSFICSLGEAALYSISQGRVETLRRRGSSAGLRLALLRGRVDEPIAAILILNTAVMTVGAIWSGALVEKHYGDFWMGVFSGAFTLLVLFLGEIIPKSLGIRFADNLAPGLAWPLQLAIWLLWPLVKVSVLLTRLFGRPPGTSHPTEQDVLSMALLSKSGGNILAQEVGWIRNILRLNDIRTRDIMTPRSGIKRLEASMPLSRVRTESSHWHYSRVLVSDDRDPDEIVGVVLRRSVFAGLLRNRPETRMRDLMRPIHFVSGDTPAHELVGFFVRNKTQIAAVRDAGGGLAGLVTMEDVLEDMIGAEID